MKRFRKRFIVLSLIVLLVVIFFVLAERSCRSNVALKGSDIETVAVLMPSVQEMLCYVGGQDSIVAISDHCVYPSSISRLPGIAGFKGIDFEALARIAPDAVFSNNVHDADKEKIESLGIKYYSFDDKSVKAIHDSMTRMKEILDLPDLINKKIEQFSNVFSQVLSEKKENALIIVGSSDGLKNIYVAGKGNIFSELLELAGFENAYKGEVEYPSLGAEELMRIDPDNIFILDERDGLKSNEKKRIVDQWGQLDLKALRRKNIFVINGNHVFIPGPRIVKLYDAIKKKKSEDI